ncbi:MAG: D-2-hydroxyacid dehydrogenase, partial [Candidatus Marinimicrobia bacterium]|nr:D-2-hydroxyacid dehydrogenase [Candidatus Neomarinimicrobiota bacterium]
QWTQWELAARITVLSGKTVGIIGLGSMGLEIAKKAKAFDMRVIATKYTVSPEDQFADVDKLLPHEKVSLLLREADYVVLTVPLTTETKHLIDKIHLKQMKSRAYLINISRGAVVDEKALIEALRAHNIAGAALDVFEEEPLPQESPLFDLDNVLLSPHISGNFPEYINWASKDFGENLNRYLTGKSLRNVVNKERGY